MFFSFLVHCFLFSSAFVIYGKQYVVYYRSFFSVLEMQPHSFVIIAAAVRVKLEFETNGGPGLFSSLQQHLPWEPAAKFSLSILGGGLCYFSPERVRELKSALITNDCECEYMMIVSFVILHIYIAAVHVKNP